MRGGAILVLLAAWSLTPGGESGGRIPAAWAQGPAPAVGAGPGAGVGDALAVGGVIGTADAAAPHLGGSGLPVPRFVSLRAEPVNMRTGPGQRYPVQWILTRRSLPLMIVAEYDTWRKVRDPQGAEGWIHQSMLTSHRTVMTLADGTLLRRDPRSEAAALARIDGGVIGTLLACPAGSAYCRVDVGGYLGWLPREGLYGLLPGEILD